jgi:hypothetical protein
LTINLSLPEGYEVAWLPEDVTITTPDVVFGITCDLDDTNHAVVWRRTVMVNERSIPVERYDEFKDSYDTLGSPKNRLVLLRKS